MIAARQSVPDVTAIEGALQVILTLPEEAITTLIDYLICHLDGLSGDPDLEDDDPTSCEAAEDCGSGWRFAKQAAH